MRAKKFPLDIRALATALAVTAFSATAGWPAAAQKADPEGELRKLDRSLRASETRRDQLRRRAS